MDSAVIFDVDGVLLDLTAPEEDAFFLAFALPAFVWLRESNPSATIARKKLSVSDGSCDRNRVGIPRIFTAWSAGTPVSRILPIIVSSF